MPDVTVFAPAAGGYSARDSALQDLLFGLALDDETPDGPSRTWVYEQGSADDVGCFEPIPVHMAIERRAEAMVLTPIEPQPPPPRWVRPSAREASEDFWRVRQF